MWLIIGGSGFIGTNFAKFLMENDYSFKIYDISKAKHILGWEPKYTVKESLKDTIEFLREEYL